MKKTFEQIFNFLFPGKCDYCQNHLQASDYIQVCKNCVKKIKIPSKSSICQRCSHPLNSSHSCPSCKLSPLPFKNISIFFNKDFSQTLLYDYKFKQKKHYSKIIADLVIKHAAHYIKKHDYIIPIPLAKQSLFERDFCQVTTIAKIISKRLKIPTIQTIQTVHLKKELSQHFKNRNERTSNTEKRFKFIKKYKQTIKNKKVLIFDDILTTGSTIAIFINTIKKETTPAIINALTFARSTLT